MCAAKPIEWSYVKLPRGSTRRSAARRQRQNIPCRDVQSFASVLWVQELHFPRGSRRTSDAILRYMTPFRQSLEKISRCGSSYIVPSGLWLSVELLETLQAQWDVRKFHVPKQYKSERIDSVEYTSLPGFASLRTRDFKPSLSERSGLVHDHVDHIFQDLHSFGALREENPLPLCNVYTNQHNRVTVSQNSHHSLNC